MRSPTAWYRPSGVERRIADLIEAGDRDAALVVFFAEIVRMSDDDLAAYREDPVWPLRAAAVHTAMRELDAEEASPAASLDRSAECEPRPPDRRRRQRADLPRGDVALDARLADGRIVDIPGARHAGHHTHVAEFTAAIRAFLSSATAT